MKFEDLFDRRLGIAGLVGMAAGLASLGIHVAGGGNGVGLTIARVLYWLCTALGWGILIVLFRRWRQARHSH